MLILAIVTVNLTLGENGIISRAKYAIEENKKAQYFENIYFEITQERIDREQQYKDEAFIESLKYRLEGRPQASIDNFFYTKKEWIKEVITCDENSDTNEDDPYKNNILIIETQDDYEIYVDVDNESLEATIREDSFCKTGEKCIITYDSNGGTGTMGQQEVRKGFRVILPENEFQRENYIFTGWTCVKNENEITYAAGSKSDIINENITLYAKWNYNVATITYHSNGGSGEMSDTEVEKNKQTALRINEFEAPTSEYEFDKWTINQDGSGDFYTDGASITVDQDTTLYAQWKLKRYLLTYDANGGTCDQDSTYITINSAYGTLPTAERDNAIFLGWYDQRTGGNKVSSETTIGTSNKTIYAHWSKIVRYQYVKWHITKLRGAPANGCLQMTEFKIYDTSGNRFSYPSGTSATSSIAANTYGGGNYTANRLLDNNTGTKFCCADYGWGSSQNGTCDIIINVGNDNYIDFNQYSYYGYTTGNDWDNRDPISWILYGSNDNETWDELDIRNDESITTSRNANTQKWSINVEY